MTSLGIYGGQYGKVGLATKLQSSNVVMGKVDNLREKGTAPTL